MIGNVTVVTHGHDFQQNRHFLKKILIFRKHKAYFQILEVLLVILTTYLPV